MWPSRLMPTPMLAYPFASFAIALSASALLSKALGIGGFSAMPYIRVFNVLSAVLFVALFLVRSRLRPALSRQRFHRAMLALLGLSVVYLGIGLVRENNRLYLLTDFVYLLMFYLTFLMGAGLYAAQAARYSHRHMMTWIIVLTAITSVLTQLKVGTPSDLLILWGACLVMAVARRDYLHSLLLVLAVAPQLPVLNRALVLAIVGGVLLLFISSSLSRKVKVLVLTLALCSAVFFVFSSTSFLQGSNFERRIKETTSLVFGPQTAELPLPLQQRIYEGEVVHHDIAQASPLLATLFGLGHGYTLDMTSSIDESVVNSQLMGGQNTHNIHLLNYALLARFGVLGSLCFVYLCALAVGRVYHLFKAAATDRNSLELLANLYIVMLILFAATASSFLFSSMLFGYFCGIANQAFRTLATVAPATVGGTSLHRPTTS